MDAGALGALVATIAEAEPTLIALIVALATGGPALVFGIYRWRKTAPQEHDDLVTRAANQAVAAMDVVLKAAADEREELLGKCKRLEKRDRDNARRITSLESRVRQLEAHWPDGHPLPDASPVG